MAKKLTSVEFQVLVHNYRTAKWELRKAMNLSLVMDDNLEERALRELGGIVYDETNERVAEGKGE
jgi:hypothetical protein